jgi:Domain of unknown function (DUF1338)
VTDSDSLLSRLLNPLLGASTSVHVQQTVAIHPALQGNTGDIVPRGVLAQALALVLFQQLLDRVPTGRAYVDEVISRDQKVVFDHGAVRTVAWPCGALPRGEAAISRVLRPLGYAMAAVYPLPRLGMTGRAWRHRDWPEDLPQFFVSEFHPERFSSGLQAAVDRVVGASTDPLRPDDVAALEQLDRDGQLSVVQAMALLPQLVACFDRQHAEPHWADYQALLAESPEMAWISTEGNAFNHATDRVPDLAAVAQAQRDLGRPIKERIEVSASGRVQQTAFRADPVRRGFVGDAGRVEHQVPGSFYEFIQRAHLPGEPGQRMLLDLAFDAGNATGIFGMTAAVPMV